MRSHGLLGSVALVLSAGSLTAQGASPCPPLGLVFDVAGGEIDEPYAFTIAGSPLSPGLVGYDVAGGPLPSPFGTLCLGFTQALVIESFALDGGGTFVRGGVVPNNPALAGQSLFAQAVVVDLLLPPGTLSLSNGVEVVFESPHAMLVDVGLATPFGNTPGNLLRVDSIGPGVSLLAPFAQPVLDAVRVPAFDCVAVLLLNGDLVCYAESDGSVLASTSVPIAGGVGRLALAGAGRLLVSSRGLPPSPFGGGTPGSLFVYELPGLVAGPSVVLSLAHPTELLARPSTSFAYLRDGFEIVIVDHVAGIEGATVSLNGSNGQIVDWLVDGNRLITLLGGVAPNPFGGSGAPPGLNGVDLAIEQPLFGTAAQLPTTSLATLLRRGPGTTGTALFVVAPSTGELFEIAPATLAVQTTAAVPIGTTFLELSSGATEWLAVASGSPGTPFTPPVPGQVFTVDPATLAGSIVANLPNETQQALAVLQAINTSAAYVVNGGDELLPMATDPTQPPGPALALPVASALWIVP